MGSSYRLGIGLLAMVVGAASGLPLGCSNGNAKAGPCDPTSSSMDGGNGCEAGATCENTSSGTPGCFAPLSIQGKVIDATNNSPIAGAHVVARDAEGAVISAVAISATDGTYSLIVPATRDAAGKPVSTQYTLRADAASYQTYPGGVRAALPIDATSAAGEPPVIASAATTIGLIPITITGAGSISGTVKIDKPGGTLVDVEGTTGVADKDGAYTVFNVPAGSHAVQGYIAGTNFAPVTATVTGGQETKGVDLTASTNPLGKVTGSVNIVNAPGGSVTSVVLVLEDTFNTNLERGEVPKGLRAGNVTSAFTIDGVPDGKYVVLAAYENDGLVRDPDPNIAGTQIPHITVAGAPVDVGNFKVTGALAVISPGAKVPDPVTGTPTFNWADDSSETGYDVVVFDSLGNKIWEDATIPGYTGSGNPSVQYGGPALQTGGYYQFRATSMKNTAPISRTEDLLGVFYVQ